MVLRFRGWHEMSSGSRVEPKKVERKPRNCVHGVDQIIHTDVGVTKNNDKN